MRHVLNMDMIYELTETNFTKLLKDGASGKQINLEDYGKLVGINNLNITDMSQDDYNYELLKISDRHL